MGFASVGSLVAAYDGGKSLITSFAKANSSGAAWAAANWYDLSMGTGNPKINVYPGGLLEAVKLWYRSAGNVWHGPSQLPATKHILNAQVEGIVATSVPCTLTLCDYLQFYAWIDCDYDGEQLMDNTITLSRYITGEGVRAFIVATQALGAAAVNWYVKYQNSDGDYDRTLSYSPLNTGSATVGQLVHAPTQKVSPFLPLQAGDKGVRKIQSVQLSAGTGGGYAAIVLAKPIMTIATTTAQVTTERSMLCDLPSLPKIHDEAFLNFLALPGAALANATILRGQLDFVWGES